MHLFSRKAVQCYMPGLLFLTFASEPPAAQDVSGKWPEKPVRVIVAAAPGSGDDFATRLLAPKLSELLRQQFIVDNRPGAGGMIGQTQVLKSVADGYTWLLAGGSMAGARYVNAAVTYDVLRDFTPVSLIETSQFVMVVHPTVPVRNAKEYVALARSQPGKMTFGTIGAGQIPYWSAILFNNMAGIKAVEVAYKGNGEAMTDMMAGRIDYYFMPSVAAVANKTKLRPLAVTSMTRSPALPEVPTMSEAALPGYDMPAWRSIMGPAGVRRDIVVALNAAIGRALEMPDVREKMLGAGSEAAPSSPEEVSKRYSDWIERFGKIAKQAGLQPQ
ncbi:MAG TPA: tripartite tricarboxylate transporter substrate-binding protein [Burkholderiales bacterium]